MSTLVVIATSHGCDNFSEFPEYYNHTKPENGWVYYLGQRAGFSQTVNLSLEGYGIDTYYTRIKHAIYNYNIDTMLLEIPSTTRFDLPVGLDFADEEYLNLDWVVDVASLTETQQHRIKNYILNFAPMDHISDPRTKRKIDQINKTSKLVRLTLTDLKKYLDINEHLNLNFISSNIKIQCEMIDQYIKSHNIRPIWFNFSANTYQFDSLECIPSNKIALNQLASQKYGWHSYQKDHYADGWHLNSDKWRTLVDDFFVEVLTRKDK